MDGQIQRIHDSIIVPAATRRERRGDRQGRPFPSPEGSPPSPRTDPESPTQPHEELPVGDALPDECGRRLDVIG